MILEEARIILKAISIVVLVLLIAYNFILASYKDTRTEGTVTMLALGVVLIYVCNV